MDGRQPPSGTDLRRGRSALRVVVALLVLGFAVACLSAPALAAEPLSLWHAYRGDERAGLEAAVAAWNEAHPEAPAAAQAIPYEALSAKLEAAIPLGNGPDVFVFAHERVGKWSRAGLVRPVDEGAEGASPGLFSAPAAEAMRADGRAWGLPLATKCLALFYDPHAVPHAPETTDALAAAARAATDPGAGRYGLGWLAGDFYFHAAFLHGFGGAVFDPGGGLSLDSPPMVRSLALVRDLAVTRGIAPDEPSSTLLGQLFNEGRLAMVLSGPWFLGEIAPGRTFSVAPLPRISETGQPMRPFLTVEAAWVSARSPRPGPAQELAAFLASGPGARIRAVRGGQTVAARAVLEDPGLGKDPVAAVFARQAALAVPMPSRPEMDAVWEPANQALRKLLRGDLEPEAAARFAQRRAELV
ncbi:extracellular solute-binding protein, partial [Myxococcota bacterium]|nr:extracellular solute-binding protein [Myxococcota bacterium]